MVKILQYLLISGLSIFLFWVADPNDTICLHGTDSKWDVLFTNVTRYDTETKELSTWYIPNILLEDVNLMYAPVTEDKIGPFIDAHDRGLYGLQ